MKLQLLKATCAALTWWRSSWTFFSRAHSLFSLPLNLHFNVSSSARFLFPLFAIWLSTSSVAIQAEHYCDSRVFQPNTLLHLVFWVDIFLFQEKKKKKDQVTLISDPKHNYCVMVRKPSRFWTEWPKGALIRWSFADSRAWMTDTPSN